MVDEELRPSMYGSVKCDNIPSGQFNTVQSRMDEIMTDVGRHGEVHAQFDGYEDDVEVRLGTAKFDFRTESVKVFDGDQYHVFNMGQYQGHYVPMEVFH